MIWAEVRVEAPDDRSESIAEILRDAGAGGVAFTGPLLMRRSAEAGDLSGKLFPESIPSTELIRVIAYYPVDDLLEGRLLYIRSALDSAFGGGHSARPIISVARVAGENWASAWKQYYHVDHVGERVVIVPSWIEYAPAPDEAVVLLDPGEAFGTGQHETTRGCIMALDQFLTPGAMVLDVGCGSGILSIVAAQLGAGRVVGVDVDGAAVKVAKSNAALNRVQNRVTIREGDLARGIRQAFDVVVANILADAVIELVSGLPRVLAPGGFFICSGFVDKSAARVEHVLAGAGHRMIHRFQVEDWVTLVSVVG